jgi:hypothetical protein
MRLKMQDKSTGHRARLGSHLARFFIIMMEERLLNKGRKVLGGNCIIYLFIFLSAFGDKR